MHGTAGISSRFPTSGCRFALPFGALEEGGLAGYRREWFARDGGLAVAALRESGADAHFRHALRAIEIGGDAFVLSGKDRLVTGGQFLDGERLYLRSERIGGAWSTVEVLADPRADPMLEFIAASIARGAPPPLLVSGGRLEWIFETTADLVGDTELAAEPAPEPVRRTPGTGTGFYLSADMLVTAAHVVEGCSAISLADGSELRLLAVDTGLDVAALGAERPTPAWLRLAPTDTRLGQQVMAVGFPYYSIAGTALHLTSGNVSALAGVDDDRRFVSFTAPVQPGSSGEPLIDRTGSVSGVVVSRLSEIYIADATGSLPQNVNYALSNVELAAFLRRNGLGPEPGGLSPFDMDAGAPPEIEAAVVPVICQ